MQRIEQLSERQRDELVKRLRASLRDNGRLRLAAFIVPQQAFDENSIRDHLSEQLPEYMLPRFYVELDTLPRLMNGKIDRSRLALPKRRTSKPSMAAVESSLAEIWCEVLGVERIHPQEDYFELGGDSITSIQIVARAAKQAIHLSPADIMENPTISELALRVSSNQNPQTPIIAEQREMTDDDLINDEQDELLRVLNLDSGTD